VDRYKDIAETMFFIVESTTDSVRQ
jgi:hypothetical protein